MRQLKSIYLKTELLPWKSLNWFQNDTFKTMSKADARKYLAALDDLDIIREFRIWEDEDGVKWILDAHHLQKILQVGIEDGLFEVPELLPCHFYDLPNRKAAAKVVIAHSSTFARVTYEGMDEFAVLNEIAIQEAKEIAAIPSITFAYWDELETVSTDTTDAEGPLEEQMKKGPDLRYKVKKPKISFPTEPQEYKILLNALKRIKNNRNLASMTDVLKHLISYEEEIDTSTSEADLL